MKTAMAICVGFAVVFTVWTFAALPLLEPRGSGGFALHVMSIVVGSAGAMTYAVVYGYGLLTKRLSVDWIMRGVMSLFLLTLTLIWLSIH